MALCICASYVATNKTQRVGFPGKIVDEKALSPLEAMRLRSVGICICGSAAGRAWVCCKGAVRVRVMVGARRRRESKSESSWYRGGRGREVIGWVEEFELS